MNPAVFFLFQQTANAHSRLYNFPSNFLVDVLYIKSSQSINNILNRITDRPNYKILWLYNRHYYTQNKHAKQKQNSRKIARSESSNIIIIIIIVIFFFKEKKLYFQKETLPNELYLCQLWKKLFCTAKSTRHLWILRVTICVWYSTKLMISLFAKQKTKYLFRWFG